MSKFKLDAPLVPQELRDQAQARLEELYEGLKTSWPGFIEREGQVTLMRMTLETLLNAKTAQHTPEEGSNLAALEAGTGTGKTIAYCLAAIVASEVLGKTVVVSTATVTLQEQLYFKDLPRLASFIPELTYELLKGRSRYVCRSRLDSALTGDVQSDWADSAEEDDDDDNQAVTPTRKLDGQSVRWFKDISKQLDDNTWNGEIDSLPSQPPEGDWKLIQADGNACHSVNCAYFKECNFYLARNKAKNAKLQIANHSLVLSALASESKLFDASETLFVFDEGHHLPEKANEQFACEVHLAQSTKVLTAFRKALNLAAKQVPVAYRPDLSGPSRLVDECKDMAKRLMDFISESDAVSREKPVLRFHHGVLSENLTKECADVSTRLKGLLKTADDVRAELLKDDDSLSPKEKEARAKAASELFKNAIKVGTLYQLYMSWAEHERIPLAKWVEWVDSKREFEVKLCSSPMTGSSGLTKGLWRHVSAAVATSATLTSCGSFEFFLRLSGMGRFKQIKTAVMPSPFNYPKQGTLRILKMRNTPKQIGYSDELCSLLPELLRSFKHGQLMIFTSAKQMKACYEALPEDLQSIVLTQDSMGKNALIERHKQIVSTGKPSILFGLQSLGEGLDLPGRLCEHVVIDKLPFAPPSSPIDEALSEWLATQNRDAFDEIAVPRTSMRLAQWVGRAVRTVDDRSTITICDTRLRTTGYGRRILQGLPNFAQA